MRGGSADGGRLQGDYELLTDRILAEITTLRRREESGVEGFACGVRQGQIHGDIERVEMPADMKGETEIRIDKLLRAIGLCSSGAEANRKLNEGAVPINGEKRRERNYSLDRAVTTPTIQVGK